MDRRLHYRRGLPLLKPLPVFSVALENNVLMGHDKNDIDHKILQILKEHKLNFVTILLTGRIHSDEVDPDSRNPTYLVAMKSSPADTWEPAVQAFRDFLDERHLQHIAVEFIDDEKSTILSFPITQKNLFTDDEVEVLYTSALRYFEHSGLKWITMTLIYRGTKPSNLHPTLFITASDLENEEWWSTILPKLETINPLVSGGRVDIELSHGAVSYSCNSSGIDITSADFRKELQMGGSIGAAGSRGSGTIGAAVKLRMGQNMPSTTFLLTCQHVTAQDECTESESITLEFFCYYSLTLII